MPAPAPRADMAALEAIADPPRADPPVAAPPGAPRPRAARPRLLLEGAIAPT